MFLRLELRRKDFANDAVRINDVGDASGQQAKCLADAELFAHGTIGVGEQGEGEIVLLCEGLMRFDRVGTDTDDFRASVGERFEIVTE